MFGSGPGEVRSREPTRLGDISLRLRGASRWQPSERLVATDEGFTGLTPWSSPGDHSPSAELIQADVIAGVDALKHFSGQPDSRRTLQVIKSKYRNDLLASLNSTPSIAEQFAWFYRFNRDPNVFQTLVESVDSLRPADVDAYAARYFSPDRRVITTLWQNTAKPAEARP